MTGPKWIVLFAACFGFIGVAIGAIGAHGLPEQLKSQGFEPDVVAKKLEQCEIGVRYQIAHALAMLAIGLSPLPGRSSLARAACGMFLAGILFFSGGLYAISLADTIGHWSIVPLGGMMFLVGWFLLFLSACRISSDTDTR
ncbi:DUF423 domain-containing protein [Pirellulaceae bacterium SH467]|jgi:uncharacterized membrane protein YgdD (TMEM256/DUF423 family)